MAQELKDVSNTTVVVLLAMTIVVTIVGTWLVLDAVISGPVKPVPTSQPSDTAVVTFTLVEPPQNAQKAQVSFTLVEPEG